MELLEDKEKWVRSQELMEKAAKSAGKDKSVEIRRNWERQG
jgi:hypothetical protein